MSPWTLPDGLTEADVDASAGFVYRITHKASGKAYIGKKWAQMEVKRKWRPSRWRSYWGSSRPLTADLTALGHDAFEREILTVFGTRAEVDYAEVEMMFHLDVLRARLPDGSRAYYNEAFLQRWFRAPK